MTQPTQPQNTLKTAIAKHLQHLLKQHNLTTSISQPQPNTLYLHIYPKNHHTTPLNKRRATTLIQIHEHTLQITTQNPKHHHQTTIHLNHPNAFQQTTTHILNTLKP